MTVSQRSPYNDRYKVEQKGKTRKSASAARPKRDVADLTPRDAAKRSTKKKSIWSRAPRPAQPAVTYVATPAMRKLRAWWWVLWSLSLVLAIGILFLQRMAVSRTIILGAWAVWIVTMVVTFYLEFGPMRKLRLAAIDASKSSGKGSKGKSGSKKDSAASGEDGAGEADASDQGGIEE